MARFIENDLRNNAYQDLHEHNNLFYIDVIDGLIQFVEREVFLERENDYLISNDMIKDGENEKDGEDRGDEGDGNNDNDNDIDNDIDIRRLSDDSEAEEV